MIQKQTESQSIDRIYRAHHNDILSYLSSKEKNLVLVEDLVQDAFLKLYAQLQAEKPIKNVAAWLKRVTYNLWIDHYRKHNITLSEDFVDLADTETSHAHGPEDCLLGIIANLPYKYKKAVYLTDVQGVKQVDAAKQLKISLSTFKSHVQRGRKLVAQGYVDCCDYEIKEDGTLDGEVKNWDECKVCRK